MTENFRTLLKDSGMNMKQFSDYFEIPYRTIQNWNLGVRDCPEYLLKLMQYKLETDRKRKH